MPLHRAPVIESFRLHISLEHAIPEDVRMWLVIAVSRSLLELDISYRSYQTEPGKAGLPRPAKHDILPSSLYACRSLVVLKLKGHILMDALPGVACLPSLKNLQLREVRGLDGESLGRLLSVCPVLENLLVDFRSRDVGNITVGKITVTVLSLQSLTLTMDYKFKIDRLEINTPSLKYLKLEDPNGDSEYCLIENMPELEEAYVDVGDGDSDIQSLIGSITCVKRLTICSQALYGDGFVFNHLEELKLCHCSECSSMLLSRLLTDSPNLRALNIFQMTDHNHKDMVLWDRPSHVPACFESSLQTFIWSGYLGRQQERKIAVYVLKRASLLKTARISSVEKDITKLEMLMDLSVSSRASSKCKLFFD